MKRIVVAEDDRSIREMIAEWLIEEGYEVSQAYDGQQALDCILGGDAFDLLMTDVNMPEKTGLELINELGEKEYVIPVLVHSTFCSLENVTYVGRIDFLSKPSTYSDFFSAVERMIGKPDGLRRIIDTSAIDLCDPMIKFELDQDLKRMDHLRYLPDGVDAYSAKVNPSTQTYSEMLHRFLFEVQYGNIVGKDFVAEGEPVMYQSEGLPMI
jgi:CheY-like chemotaxis protein